MTDKQQTQSSSGIGLGDIYFIIFRHKWKIILCSIAGIVAAAVMYVQQPSFYQTEAKLYVRYVQDVQAPSAMGGSQLRTTEAGGGNPIASEVQILTSLDLAGQVADVVGADKILAKAGGGKDRNQAAALVARGLTVEVPKESSVLQLTFKHPDPSIVQQVLNQLIESYKKRHVDIHRPVALYDEFLTQKVDALRSQLLQTEKDLKDAKKQVGGIPLADVKNKYGAMISRFQQQQSDTITKLAELQANLTAMEPRLPTKSNSTNSETGVPSGKVYEYKGIASRLEILRQKKEEYLTQYTEENNLVKSVLEQIATAEARKSKLEEEFPRLTELPVVTQNQSSDSAILGNIGNVSMQIFGLRAVTNTLNLQIQEAIAGANNINDLEGPITVLQRTRDLQEQQYIYFQRTLETARFDADISSGKISNINVAQSPSPPFKSPNKVNKKLGMSVVGGVGSGIALAFLLEMFLSRTLKRPLEVEARLRLPLILSIPKIKNNQKLLASNGGANGHQLLNDKDNETASETNAVAKLNGNGTVAPWDASHPLRPFYEGLRDRLMTDFENRKLTHNPKLVAVTSCSRGSGVTSIAAGLAATLSETGDGNVLLVDMNPANGSVHPFFRGKPSWGLAELLEDPKNDAAMVQENLYMASGETNKDKLPRILPKRFTNLVPKLKASEYDYIIFDMPPISQTSVTPRLAGFMDMVLLVIESEKTDREVARRATQLLEESKAHVNLVLNKTRKYVPAQLHQEFLDGV